MKPDHLVPAERDLPPGRLQARKEHLVSELAHSLGASRPAKRRRRWVALALPAAILLLAATAWTMYALTRDATVYGATGCYDSPALDANVTVIDPGAQDPVAVCSQLWARGDVAATRSVPPLHACVLETGAVAVFPSRERDVCESLGLAELPETYRARAKREAALRAALSRRLGVGDTSRAGEVAPSRRRCVGYQAARKLVRRELDRRGFSTRRIEEGEGIAGEGFSAARPCAGLAIDSGRDVVILVPEERPRR